MELVQSSQVQDLFCTGWYQGPVQGLCRWRDRTYLYSMKLDSMKIYLYSLEVSEIVEIEMSYKHLAGLVLNYTRNRSGYNLELFHPTLSLATLGSIYTTESNDRALAWWVKTGSKGVPHYTRTKKPIAIWERDRPVQQV